MAKCVFTLLILPNTHLTNFYSVNGNIAMRVLDIPMTISRASCNAGDTAISGGYRSTQVDHLLFEQEDIDTWATGIITGNPDGFCSDYSILF